MLADSSNAAPQWLHVTLTFESDAATVEDGHYSDDQGDFLLDSDAGRASRSARKILDHMGIIALGNMDDEVRARILAATIQEAEWSETVKERIRQSLS